MNHINGVKTDNDPSNLEWVARADNTRHQWKIGLVNIRGDNHPSVKLPDCAIPAVFAKRRDGASVRDIARHYRVSAALIYKVLKGTKRKVK